MARRGVDPTPTIGVGITVTRKLGNAVARNRIRRRLRAALRQVLPGPARPGVDYVVIARPPAMRRAFSDLVIDLRDALTMIGRGRRLTE